MGNAVISECGTYRYRLTRGDEPRLAFVMLNPSTADAEVDDPTIRRCLGFAKREGFPGIEVVNLYAFRATKPSALLAADDPIGPDNWQHIEELAQRRGKVVCAWGAGAPNERHVRTVIAWLQDGGSDLLCLGFTASGAPRHPLYVRADAPLVQFR